MEASDWLSLLAIIISLYSILITKKSDKRNRRIEQAQKNGQIQLSLMNCQLKMETQIIRFEKKLAHTDPNSENGKSLYRLISKVKINVESVEVQAKRLEGAKVIDEVELEEIVALVKLLERQTEHLEALPLPYENA